MFPPRPKTGVGPTRSRVDSLHFRSIEPPGFRLGGFPAFGASPGTSRTPAVRHRRPRLRRFSNGGGTRPLFAWSRTDARKRPVSRNGSSALLSCAVIIFDPPHFRGPVRKCQAEPFEIHMSRKDLSLYGRDLPAATGDSRSLLPPRHRDVVERSAIDIQLGLLAGESLPALNDHVHVLRI